MPEFRITKYDPALRDASGAYLRPAEWTSISDVGKTTSLDEYTRVEAAYLDVILAFLEEARIDGLTIHWHPDTIGAPTDYANGEHLGPQALRHAMQRVLREEIGGQFGGESGAFVHFGYDYYMYLGVPVECPRSEALAAERGLFVEPFVSPYHLELEQDEDEDAPPPGAA